MAPKIETTRLIVLVPDEYRGQSFDLTLSLYSVGSSEDANIKIKGKDINEKQFDIVCDKNGIHALLDKSPDSSTIIKRRNYDFRKDTYIKAKETILEDMDIIIFGSCELEKTGNPIFRINQLKMYQ